MSIAIPSSWDVTRLAGALGAEVRGFKLADLDEAGIESIKALLLEHLVLFFPDQHPDVDTHVSFGRHFGKLEGHPHLKNPYTQHPELFELAATNGGVADEWHTDITFQEQPALMSILHMVKSPEVGGDTMWSSLYAAYNELSAPMQELCEGLTALHDALPHNHPERMTTHPVVRVHPETGKKALYVNEHFTRRIVEMNATESDALLAYLTRWVTNPRFTVRYRWTEGTVAMWDNRCTQHFVLNDFEGERIIQRVTVMGDKPVGAQNPRWQPWVRPGRLSATSRHDRQLFQYLKSKEAEKQAS
ncbi:MAG: TauD/TfdA family dioxygenase [Pseudomonadales bacterium]|nr:TauD/TfdA family dioxygenase [Pseudomonadales bacterium]